MGDVLAFEEVSGLCGGVRDGARGCGRGQREPRVRPGPGSRPSWARASNLVRRVDPASRVDFLVFLGWRDAAGVTAVASAVSDPNSASYGRYLSAAQFRARFSPARADVDAVRRWLGDAGLRVDTVPASRLWVAASGSARDVERALGTGLAMYRTGSSVRRATTGSSRPGGARRHREGVRRPVRRPHENRHLEPSPEAPGVQERTSVQRVLGREGSRHPAPGLRSARSVLPVWLYARPAAERVRDE